MVRSGDVENEEEEKRKEEREETGKMRCSASVM